MRFDKISCLMEKYEQSLSQFLPPRIWPLIRLEGRGFDDLAKRHQLQIPYDSRLETAFIEAAKRLMNCGFQSIYAYIASSEISILIDRNDTIFQRNIPQWLGVAAGEASAAFTHAFQDIAIFIPRLCLIPDIETASDYFRWRQETRQSTALHQLCYHSLLEEGQNASQTTAILTRLSFEQKLDLLRSHQITYRNQPAYFRLGIGLRWNTVLKTGINPKTQQVTAAKRRVLEVIKELPSGEQYADWIKDVITKGAKNVRIP